MKVAFFTEGGYQGKVPRDTSMRTDQSWVCALKATHYPIGLIIEEGCKEHYDIGIV